MKTTISMRILISMLLFLVFNTANAQFGFDDFEDIQKLKEIPLLVVLEGPNDRTVKKLIRKNPAELKNYIASVEAKNEVIKTALEKNWKASRTIKFIKKSELESYKTKENNGKYAYFLPLIYDKMKSKESSSGYLVYSKFSVYIVGDVTPVHEVRYSSEYEHSILNEKDLSFVCNEIQGHLQHREDVIAGRRAKKAVKEKSQLAKTTFTDDDN